MLTKIKDTRGSLAKGLKGEEKCRVLDTVERNGRIPRSWHELARNVVSPPRVEEDRRRKPRASVKGGQGGGRREGTERG